MEQRCRTNLDARSSTLLCLIVWMLSTVSVKAQVNPGHPNIIYIEADDLGYGDLGCYGQRKIETPNIDRMAAEGIRFTQVYAGSTVCAPSRCALMTGLHTGHARIRGNRQPGLALSPEDITVAEVLKPEGYRTGIFGKWGLGGAGSQGIPNLQGFDEWFGYLDQVHAHNYYTDHLWRNQDEVFLTKNFGGLKGQYSHDLFTQEALKFLDESKGQHFFLYLAYTLPHANNELGRATGNGMEVPPEKSPYAGRDWPEPERNFATMVSRLDRDVGMILTELQRLSLDTQTIVFFTSDNGPHQEGGHNARFFESSGPLRGGKRDLYEGGIRIPMIVRWTDTIQPHQVSDQVWAFWDFLPTAAELAGAKVPPKLDGISVLPTLLGQSQTPHEFLYWEFHEHGFAQAVRMGDWKGIRRGRQGSMELFNLKSDLRETNDVAQNHPEIVTQIAEMMETARTESPDFPVSKAAASTQSPPNR
jgi:arylsulfatase A-like enzyme